MLQRSGAFSLHTCFSFPLHHLIGGLGMYRGLCMSGCYVSYVITEIQAHGLNCHCIRYSKQFGTAIVMDIFRCDSKQWLCYLSKWVVIGLYSPLKDLCRKLYDWPTANLEILRCTTRHQ